MKDVEHWARQIDHKAQKEVDRYTKMLEDGRYEARCGCGTAFIDGDPLRALKNLDRHLIHETGWDGNGSPIT